MALTDLLLEPSVHVGGLVLWSIGRATLGTRRLPRTLALVTLGYIALVFFSPVPTWLGRWLEGRYPPINLDAPVDTAVVLTGRTVGMRPEFHQFEYSTSADRILEPVRRVRHGQVKRLIVSGADPGEGSGPNGESFAMRALAVDLGVPAESVTVEPESRNTRESARRVQPLLPPGTRGGFLLVTSAMHMPRAMLAFRQEGLDPIAYPVDFRVPRAPGAGGYRWGVEASRLLADVLHEYVGYLAYSLRLR